MDLMIQHLEPLLYEYKVDIGFYGHNHVVQRHAAVYNRTVVQKPIEMKNDRGETYYLHKDPEATIHMVIGTAGAMFTKNAIDPPPAWNEIFFYEYGYARVVAVDESRLEWEWVSSETKQVMDRVVIIQSSRKSSSDTVEGLGAGERAAIIVGMVVGAVLMVFALYIMFARPGKPSPAISSVGTGGEQATVSVLHEAPPPGDTGRAISRAVSTPDIQQDLQNLL